MPRPNKNRLTPAQLSSCLIAASEHLLSQENSLASLRRVNSDRTILLMDIETFLKEECRAGEYDGTRAGNLLHKVRETLYS